MKLNYEPNNENSYCLFDEAGNSCFRTRDNQYFVLLHGDKTSIGHEIAHTIIAPYYNTQKYKKDILYRVVVEITAWSIALSFQKHGINSEDVLDCINTHALYYINDDCNITRKVKRDKYLLNTRFLKLLNEFGIKYVVSNETICFTHIPENNKMYLLLLAMDK